MVGVAFLGALVLGSNTIAHLHFSSFERTPYVFNAEPSGRTVPRAFFLFSNLREFNAKFALMKAPGSSPAPFTQEFFATKLLLVVVESGPPCSMRARDVSRSGDTLILDYFSSCSVHAATRTTATPLFIAVDRLARASVEFIENGKVIGKAATLAPP